MKQTAIQELIQEMEQLKQTKLYQVSFRAIDDCIALAYSKLEIEKIQIIDAANFDSRSISENGYRKGEQYYNETFITNEK
jgi:hypothetical protein